MSGSSGPRKCDFNDSSLTNFWQDEDYEAAGAKLVGAKEAFGSNIVLKVRPPQIGKETDLLQPRSRYKL